MFRECGYRLDRKPSVGDEDVRRHCGDRVNKGIIRLDPGIDGKRYDGVGRALFRAVDQAPR